MYFRSILQIFIQRNSVRRLAIASSFDLCVCAHEIRVGLHAGEMQLTAMAGLDHVAGIAVHIGARVPSQAEPGEILVSSTTKDLITGAGIKFKDHGMRVLKGVPGEWHIFAVAAA